MVNLHPDVASVEEISTGIFIFANSTLEDLSSTTPITFSAPLISIIALIDISDFESKYDSSTYTMLHLLDSLDRPNSLERLEYIWRVMYGDKRLVKIIKIFDE